MLRKLSLGLVCALAIAACSNTINGVLVANQTLTFNAKKAAPLAPGKYEAALKASKKEVKLSIDVPGQKKATEVSFKVPKSVSLPQENGSFELLAEQSGQPYDVKGTVKTVHVDGQEKWDWESCTYQAQRQECYYGHNGHPQCYIVTYTVHGTRNVRYFVRNTTQSMDVNLLTATRAAAGNFNATEYSTSRVYTATGACR